MASVEEQLKAREQQSQTGIQGAYDTSLNAQKQSLQDAFDASLGAQQSAGQQIRQQQDTLSGDLAVQNSRNTNNINQFADARNMNRQAGSQAALQLGQSGNAAAGKLAYQQNLALQENQRQQELAATQYQSRVAAALADNDYKRAAALLDDYNNQNTWREQQAQILASYGNFEPYAEMYGEDAANGMQKIWQAQNPLVAYNTGKISAEQYKQLTGSYPPGYTPPWSGGINWGYYGGSDDTGGDGNLPIKTTLIQRGAKVGDWHVDPRDPTH